MKSKTKCDARRYLVAVGFFVAGCTVGPMVPPNGNLNGNANANANGSNGNGSDNANDNTSGNTNDNTPEVMFTVTLETTLGEIVIRLEPDAAPFAAVNFIKYVNAGFYDGRDNRGATVFHRVVPGRFIHAGALTESLDAKAALCPPIQNESNNGQRNDRGAVAMYWVADFNGATSEFFINLANNDDLNFMNEAQPGYTVFGWVIDGMDVVDEIANLPTVDIPPVTEDVPADPPVIQNATVSNQ